MKRVFRNDKLTDGIIGPRVKMLGPVDDGTSITFETAPGCWGPMISPSLKGGHEVNIPISIQGAKVGDSIIVNIRRIRVRSRAASSGVDERLQGRFVEDPIVLKKCPRCGAKHPESKVDGIGLESIKCVRCGASVSPFRMLHGYTMIFDDERKVGLTVNSEICETIAKNPSAWAKIPHNSRQFSILLANKSDIQGIVSRLLPFMGNIGTIPSVNIPDSRNAGDSAVHLLSTTHPYAITKEQYDTCLTDGHMDIDAVREGAVLVCPVKVDGAGLYAGDMHAQQGDGEIAGHTTDVSGELNVEVSVIKNMKLEGPLLIPRLEDLPPLAKPFRENEYRSIRRFAKKMGVDLENNAPIQVIGTGADLNNAAATALRRAASAFDMTLEEVKNRVTITGGIEIGRLPGVVQATLKVPFTMLEKIGIAKHVKRAYKLPF